MCATLQAGIKQLLLSHISEATYNFHFSWKIEQFNMYF